MINWVNSVVNFNDELFGSLKYTDFKAITAGQRPVIVTLLTYLIILTLEAGRLQANLSSKYVDATAQVYQRLNRSLGDPTLTEALEMFRQSMKKEEPSGLQQIADEIVREATGMREEEGETSGDDTDDN